MISLLLSNAPFSMSMQYYSRHIPNYVQTQYHSPYPHVQPFSHVIQLSKIHSKVRAKQQKVHLVLFHHNQQYFGFSLSRFILFRRTYEVSFHLYSCKHSITYLMKDLNSLNSRICSFNNWEKKALISLPFQGF